MTNEDKLNAVMEDIFILRNYHLKEADKYHNLLTALETMRTRAHITDPEVFEQMINEEILKWETEIL